MENILNQMKNEVLSIETECRMIGQGIVNFDSNEQKFIVNKIMNCGVDSNDNVLYSKKNIKKNEDGTYKTQLKISSSCIKHNLFGGGEALGAEMWKFATVACHFIASPMGYMKGYMCADSDESFHKASCLTILDAIDDNAVITTDFHSRSGRRDDTSLYKAETTGETSYKLRTFLNIKEAQFLSQDNINGEPAVATSYVEGRKDGLSELDKAFMDIYGRIPYTKGVYTADSELFGNSNGRYGFKMDDEFIKELIKTYLHKLLDLEIRKSNAYAKMDSVRVRFILNGFEKSEWIELTHEMIDSLDFKVYQFYTEASQHDWEERNALMEELKEKAKASKKEKKTKKSKGAKKENEESENDKANDKDAE